MAYECIVFSDPRSTTRIQLATRDGSQGTLGQWQGIMKFEKLKVFSAQNRNSTCTFNITSYNTVDDIFTWMLPGIGVFVVHLGMLRFSGVITKVDGSYVGTDGKQVFNVTCESDAHYLMNYSPIPNVGFVGKNILISTLLPLIVSPYSLWVDNGSGALLYYSDSDNVINYTITNKPILTQVQEICQITGCTYKTKTRSTLGNITGIGYNVIMNSTSPDGFLTLSSNLGWGSHNKYILVLISDSSYQYHNCILPIASTNATTNTATISTDSTHWKNNWQFITGRKCLLIQHPVVEIRRDFYWQASTPKTFYMNPSSNTYNTVCWDFNPLAEKNDIITKSIVSGMDSLGNTATVSFPASYYFNSSTKAFCLDSGLTRTVNLNESVNLTDTTTTPGKVQVYTDEGITWAVGDIVLIAKLIDGYGEKFYIATITNAGYLNGRPVAYLNKGSNFANTYHGGDVVTLANVSYGKIYVNDNTGFTANQMLWVGREYLQYIANGSDARGMYILVNRATGLYPGAGNPDIYYTSSKGYVVRSNVYPHKKGCPILSPAWYEGDDCYSTSPMKTYGVNTRQFNISSAPDIGTIELAAYNIVRNLCVPKQKGNLSCMIQALTENMYGYTTPSSPGSAFNVNFFGTMNPTSGYYQIMSMDMDFDTGTAVVQFGEYDIQLMQWLQQSGLKVTIS